MFLNIVQLEHSASDNKRLFPVDSMRHTMFAAHHALFWVVREPVSWLAIVFLVPFFQELSFPLFLVFWVGLAGCLWGRRIESEKAEKWHLTCRMSGRTTSVADDSHGERQRYFRSACAQTSWSQRCVQFTTSRTVQSRNNAQREQATGIDKVESLFTSSST